MEPQNYGTSDVENEVEVDMDISPGSLLMRKHRNSA